MLESDLMKHVDDIEAVAKKVGLTCRRNCVRSLVTIQIQESNGQWVLFDPVRQAKDVSKLIYAAALKGNFVKSEEEFRLQLVKGILEHDLTI